MKKTATNPTSEKIKMYNSLMQVHKDSIEVSVENMVQRLGYQFPIEAINTLFNHYLTTCEDIDMKEVQRMSLAAGKISTMLSQVMDEQRSIRELKIKKREFVIQQEKEEGFSKEALGELRDIVKS